VAKEEVFVLVVLVLRRHRRAVGAAGHFFALLPQTRGLDGKYQFIGDINTNTNARALASTPKMVRRSMVL